MDPDFIPKTEEDYVSELTRFRDGINAHASEINAASPIGDKLIKGVLTSTLVDVHVVLCLLRTGNVDGLKINKTVWEDFYKHAKRSFLLDLWHAVEAHLRSAAKVKNIVVKSRTAVAREVIEELIQEVGKDSPWRVRLNSVRRMLTGNFIDFGSVRGRLLEELPASERVNFQTFLEIFQTMRNSAHDNFHAGRTASLQSSFISAEFKEGQPFNLTYSRCFAFLKGSRALFKALNI